MKGETLLTPYRLTDILAVTLIYGGGEGHTCYVVKFITTFVFSQKFPQGGECLKEIIALVREVRELKKDVK